MNDATNLEFNAMQHVEFIEESIMSQYEEYLNILSRQQKVIVKLCVRKVFEPFLESYDVNTKQYNFSLHPTLDDFTECINAFVGYDAYCLQKDLKTLKQDKEISQFLNKLFSPENTNSISKEQKKKVSHMAKVTLLSHSPNPELYIAAAAKLCYSSSNIPTLLDNLTPEKTEAFLQKLTEMGHESPIEHVTFTFGIEGVSRSLLAQITRHRMASFSVQSQRYVMETNMQYVTPPEIAAIPEATERYQKAMNDAEQAYHQLTDILKEKHLKEMLEAGMSEKAANSAAEKKAIEDARFVLPNACETKMIVTMNARSLYNFFHLRCCSRAQWEIREVATEMLRLVKDVSPTLFRNSGPRCVCGPCPEGKMSCGKALMMREYFKAL